MGTRLQNPAVQGDAELTQLLSQLNAEAPPQGRDICFARDRDGRNLIHLAAIQGRLDILKLVNEYDELMQAALEKVDHKETILHLCVKHNQPGALALLLQIFSSGWNYIIDAKNRDGDTILHMAVKNNQNQVGNQYDKCILNIFSFNFHIFFFFWSNCS